MTVVSITAGGVSAAYARDLTDRIKVAVEGTWHLIVEAYQSRSWSVLGYPSWDEYCTREFGTSRLRLPREERAEQIASLRDSGLSLRAIRSATGYSRNTIASDLQQVAHFEPPAPEPAVPEVPPPPAEQAASEPPPRRPDVKGLDGKTYTQAPKPAETADPPKARRKPLPDQFSTATYDLRKVAERVARLVEDDRFPQNAEKVAAANRSDLLRARDLLQEVIDRLPQA